MIGVAASHRLGSKNYIDTAIGTLPHISGNWTSIASDGTTFVAMSQTNTYATSIDGIHWTTRTLPSAYGCDSIVWTGSSFVGIGSGNTYLSFVSSDGITWLTYSLPSALITGRSPPSYVSNAYLGTGTRGPGANIAWNGSKIMVLAIYVDILDVTVTYSYFTTSSDGITWSPLVNMPARGLGHTKNGIISSNGSRFVTYSIREPVFPSTILDEVSFYTDDNGVTWNNGPTTTPGHGTYNSMTSNGTEFFILQQASTISPFYGNQILLTPNGSGALTTHTITNQPWNSISSNGSRIVAVGDGNTAVTYDGSTWNNITLPLSANWTAITGRGINYTICPNPFVAITWGSNNSIALFF